MGVVAWIYIASIGGGLIAHGVLTHAGVIWRGLGSLRDRLPTIELRLPRPHFPGPRRR